MDRMIPPELMGLAPQPPVQAPNPAAAAAVGTVPPGAAMPGQPVGPPPAPAAPPAFPTPPTQPQLGPAPQEPDPVLTQLLGGPDKSMRDPELLRPDEERQGYLEMPDEDFMLEVAHHDYEEHGSLIARFMRDLELYRQSNPANVPPMFDPLKEIAFRSATVSNIVNKLTNMSSGIDWQYIIPFKDEKSKENSQIAENWLMQMRAKEEEAYSYSGGDASLQWDEFWYLYQNGRVVSRTLPDAKDREYPFDDALLDPATCYPTWGHGKSGMIRMTRRYTAKVIDILKLYSKNDPDLERKIAEKLPFEAHELSRYYWNNGEAWEYWDTWNYAVFFQGVCVHRVAHKLGYVPFTYVTARGEPASVNTPDDKNYRLDENWNAVYPASQRDDLAQKGVSVFHHIVNTHRLTEITYTILLSEVLAARNPATITYSVPQMAGQSPPPVKTSPGANNQRVLNSQRVEIVPTSPRPTDTSPILNKVQGEVTEGTINPAMYGSMDGSNIAGFAVESLISAAKDTVLPYHQAFERYQALKARLKLKQYVSHASELMAMKVAMEGQYGSAPTADMTRDVVLSTGYQVDVEIMGIADQALPMMMNVASQAVKEGMWSRRKAMEKLGEKDPSKMLQDIIAERAIEHPEIMENIIIPQVFIKQGNKDLAYFWGMMVVMPKMMQTMSGLMGGGMPPGMGPPGGGGPPGMPGMPPGIPPDMAPPGGGDGPQQNGMSNPMMGRDQGPPTGPLPGQGRGPA